MRVYILNIFKIIQKKIKDKKTDSIFLKIEQLSIVLAILGITIVQILSSIWNSFSFVKMYNEEKNIQQIKVSQDYEYIEQILGKPMVKKDINLPLSNKTKCMIGSKAIFCSQYYTIITYFDDEQTLQGYFLISHKKLFIPKMFRNKKVIGKKLSNYTNDLFNGHLTIISSSYGSRRDGSSHFMKYYTHHLATNGCLIGVGVTSLGFYDNYKIFNCLTNDKENFVFATPIDYDEYKERFEQINKAKINMFSMFAYDNS